jgi:P-type conjugative transfer protein TrbL
MKCIKFLYIPAFALAAVALTDSVACAQSSAPDLSSLFNNFQQQFISVSSSGMTALQPYATGLLASLITIDLVMLGSRGALGHHLTVHDILWRLIKWGLFVYFARQYSSYVTSIYNSFTGQVPSLFGASNVSLIQNPSLIVTQANSTMACVEQMKNLESGFSGSLLSFVYWILWTLSVILYCMVALAVVSTTCIYYLSAAFGYIFFPFMLLRQTQMFSGSVVRAVMSGGLRLAVMAVVVSIGGNIITSSLPQVNCSTGQGATMVGFWDMIKVIIMLGLWSISAFKLPTAVTSALLGSAGGSMGLSGLGSAVTGAVTTMAVGAAAAKAARKGTSEIRAAVNAGAKPASGSSLKNSTKNI